MNCPARTLIAGVAILVASPFINDLVVAAPTSSDLQGAWIQQHVRCDAVYVTHNGRHRFRDSPRDLFTSAFIIAGNRLTTPNASCQIVSIANRGPRQELSLSCTTPISTDRIKALLSLESDGALSRYFDAADQVGNKYQRCGR
jgi:hypothetical protein